MRIVSRALATAFALAPLLAALAGCATLPGDAAQADLGSELQRRSHAGLRPAGGPAAERFPPGVSPGNVLTENDVVAIALWNNAAFQENLTKLGFARSDLAQAGMLANPTLSLLFPIGPKQLEFTAMLPLEALWLRPKRIAIAERESQRIAQSLLQSGLDLVRDVKIGLSELGLAADRRSVAGQALQIREQMFDLATRRQRLGDLSELDALAARAELERAREESERAKRDQAIVRERLGVLLGWPLGDTVVDAPAPDVAPLPTRTDLEKYALSARPDLRASELALESAGRKAGLAAAEIFTLSGILDANAAGRDGFEIGPGIALPLPILNQNQANRIRAAAEVERAGWNYLGTRQRIVGEVREALLKLEQASATLRAYDTQVLPPFEELERTARRGYELGEISPAVVQEHARQLLGLQLRRAELRAELRRAWAELERSVGTRLPLPARLPSNPS